MRHVKAVAMASSVTQWSSGSSYAPASIAVSWPAAPASGDVLIVAFWNNGQSSGAANTYTPPAGWSAIDTNASHAYATYEVFEHVASAGEPNSYTFTPQAAQREHAWIAADVSSASGVDQAGDAFVNNGTAYTTPSLTPAQAGEFAIAFNAPMTLSAVTWSNPSSWTLGTGPSPTWHGEAISQALSGTAQISAASTLSSAASGFAGIVLLAPSASQPTATPSPTPTPSMTPSPAPTPTPSSTPGGGGGAAPAPAQWSSGASFAPASIAVSLAAAPAPGDLLIVAFWNNGQSSGAANTYAPPAGWSIVDENTSHIYATFEAFSHVVGAGESNRYAFTPQAAQREQAWIALDVGNAAGVDKGSDAYVSGSTYSPPALSPAQSGELAVVFNVPMVLSSVTWSNPASWTLGTGPTSPWHGEAVYQGVSSAPVTESSTLSAAASGFSAIVLVAGSSAPPTPTPTPSAVPQTVDWSTMGFDNQRTGYNPNEKTLGPSSFGSLHALWSSPPSVGYQMVGEPVLATNVTVSGSSRNLLYAGGQSGVFYAIDADTGAVVWSKQLGSGSYTCSGGGSSAFGIEGAAALDRARNRVYVPDGLNQVHALDLSTGAEASGWPASIASSTGHDFIYAGLTFNPNNGVLYAETSSTCDISPWYGRISAINTATGAVTATFYPTQGSSGGGIWGFGGASIDPSTNDVFIATGNADGATQNAYYSEQIVELTPDLSSVIAANYPNIPSADDSDFGATPLLFQPPGCPPLLAAVNKSGAFVLYNRTSITSGPVQMILMSVANSTGSFIGVPSYDPVTNDVYVGLPSTFGIYKPGAAAFGITGSCTLNPTPVWNAVFGPDVAGTTNDAPRSPITIANGVVYVSGYSDDTTYAFDASSGAKLWSAPLNDIGIVGPVVANGRLYVGDYGGTIHAWQP